MEYIQKFLDFLDSLFAPEGGLFNGVLYAFLLAVKEITNSL